MDSFLSRKLYAFLIILILVGCNDLHAQQGFASKLQDMIFGDVFIGYSKDILHSDPGAAKFYFEITGQKKNQDVSIQFDLPRTLNNGPDQIPINFSSNQAAWSFIDQTAGRTTFDPQKKLKIKKIGSNKDIYIWLGGSITSAAGQSPGIYSANIIITIDY